jgi:CRISPR-associated protein Csm5
MNRPFKVRLHVISPLHIGCDDAYEPTGFVIDRKRKKLVVFDPIEFVQRLSDADRKKFLDICAKGTIGSLIDIYKFMDGQSAAITGSETEVSDEFIGNYDRVKSLPTNNEDRIKQELNKFAISRTSFLPFDNSSYIPGTSLKGSLRTGWLNVLNRRENLPPSRSAKELEEKLLGGSFQTDPFRLVMVADLLPIGIPKTRICYAVNKKKRPSDKPTRGIPQLLETVEPGAIYEGLIKLETPLTKAAVPKPVPTGLEFFKQLSAFFAFEMENEEQILKNINMPALIQQKMRIRFGDSFGVSVFPIRLGRHSGAESVTIDGHRNILIMGKKGDTKRNYSKNSTTLWLAAESKSATSGLLPFGWAALEILEADPVALYPERLFSDLAHVSSLKMTVTIPKSVVQAEHVLWEKVPLDWHAGTGTVIVKGPTGQKASAGKGAVSEETITRLKKGKPVFATVTLEKQANLLMIVKIEV